MQWRTAIRTHIITALLYPVGSINYAILFSDFHAAESSRDCAEPPARQLAIIFRSRRLLWRHGREQYRPNNNNNNNIVILFYPVPGGPGRLTSELPVAAETFYTPSPDVPKLTPATFFFSFVSVAEKPRVHCCAKRACGERRFIARNRTPR